MIKKILRFIACIIFLLPLSSAAHPAWGLEVDEAGNLYFADILHNGRGSLWKLSPDGNLQLLAADFHAHNVNLDTAGNPVSAHGEGNHAMLRFGRHGINDTLFQSDDYRKFNGGNAAYTPAGEIIFGAKNFLWKIGKDGHPQKLSNHRFGWNQVIYADGLGNYYGTEIGDGNGKIIKINARGEAEIVAENLLTIKEEGYDPHSDILLGMKRGPDGHLYVAETAGQRIIKIAGKHNETFYKSEGSWFPCALAFDSEYIYVLENGWQKTLVGPRIVRVDKNGTKTVLIDFENQ